MVFQKKQSKDRISKVDFFVESLSNCYLIEKYQFLKLNINNEIFEIPFQNITFPKSGCSLVNRNRIFESKLIIGHQLYQKKNFLSHLARGLQKI